jgi:hypothetical protein
MLKMMIRKLPLIILKFGYTGVYDEVCIYGIRCLQSFWLNSWHASWPVGTATLLYKYSSTSNYTILIFSATSPPIALS